jgi:hypothetical protein
MEGRMGGSITLIVVFVGIVAGATALWMYRRRSASPRPQNSPNGPAAAQAKPEKKAEQWGVRVGNAHKEKACPQVRGLLGKEFPLDHKPPLPVKDCPFPHQCECHYVKLFDRRKEERRSGKERRAALRAEKGHQDRRSGNDRRKGKSLDWT